MAVGKWETCFWFSTFHGLVAGAVGMWESRVLCEISKEWWEEGKSCCWICTLSTAPPFPQLSSFLTLSPFLTAFVDRVFAMGGWPGAAPESVAAAAAWRPLTAGSPGASRFPRDIISDPDNGSPLFRLPI